MDIKKIMILIRGEDQTAEIESYQYDKEKARIIINYKNGLKPYPFSEDNVQILEKPKVIDINGWCVFVDQLPVLWSESILDFEKKLRIFQTDRAPRTVEPESLSLLESGAKDKDARMILVYLKDIAQYTSEKSRYLQYYISISV